MPLGIQYMFLPSSFYTNQFQLHVELFYLTAFNVDRIKFNRNPCVVSDDRRWIRPPHYVLTYCALCKTA